MAMDMFFRIDHIRGESKDAEHAGEIDVLAWSWGLSNAGGTHSSPGVAPGKPSLQDLSYTCFIDASATALMTALARGTHLRTAVLTVRKAGGDAREYLTVSLTDVFVTSYSTGGSGGEDRLTANVTLNFADVVITYTPAPDGGPVKSTPFHWNVVDNKG